MISKATHFAYRLPKCKGTNMQSFIECVNKRGIKLDVTSELLNRKLMFYHSVFFFFVCFELEIKSPGKV